MLTDARVAPWRSSRPLSSEGDETTRWWSPSGKRVGVGRPCGSCPPPSAMESEPAGRQAPFRKRVAAARRWGSGPPLSAHGWRTGRVAGSGLNPEGRASAGGRDLRHLLATTQLVDGACLIRRYRAVRFRGGQPRRDSSVGSERRAHNAEVVSSMLTLATAGAVAKQVTAAAL